MADTVILNRRDARAEIILNRPPKNLLDEEMISNIVKALDPLREDEDLKVLVIRGASGIFCSGIEVAERSSERAGLVMPEFTRVFDHLNHIGGITVSLVEGEAHDGGFELASFCDMVFATDDATFRHPEINMALFPPISAAMLPRIVGRNKALEWMIIGDEITAKEAHQAGIVNRVWAKHAAQEELENIVKRIESLSQPALVWTKQAVDKSLYSPVMDGMRTSESIYMLELMRNLDPHEGIKAALENRKPEWRNR